MNGIWERRQDECTFLQMYGPIKVMSKFGACHNYRKLFHIYGYIFLRFHTENYFIDEMDL